MELHTGTSMMEWIERKRPRGPLGNISNIF